MVVITSKKEFKLSVPFTAWPIQEDIDKDNWVLKQRIRQGCRLSLEQLGYYHAHVSLWKHCIQLGQSLFVVEDRANLTLETMKPLQLFWERMKGIDYDFIYIGHKNTTPKQYITQFIDEPNVAVLTGRQGLFAYVISPTGAQVLLEKAIPYEYPIDSYVSTQTLRDYAMYPTSIGIVGEVPTPTPFIRTPGVRYKRKKSYPPSKTQTKSGLGSRKEVANLPRNKPRAVTTSK